MLNSVRVLTLAAGIVFIFATVVAILLMIMPGQRTNTDYLVIGGVATFTSMIVLFIALITHWTARTDVFFKRREKKSKPSD